MIPRRGEIWWVALDPSLGSEISKTRPCVILTRDLVNQHRRTVVVVPLSSTPSAHPPIRVAVACDGKSAVAVVDQIRAVSKERLKSKIGDATTQETNGIAEALREILDIT